MPTFNTPGESVEGEKVLAYGRKIIPSGLPVMDKSSRKLRFSIGIKRGGGAIVEKPYSPPIARVATLSHLNRGDEVSGEMLEGWSEKKFSADRLNVGGARTGTHPVPTWMMDGNCFVRLLKDWLKRATLSTTAVPALLAAEPARISEALPALRKASYLE